MFKRPSEFTLTFATKMYGKPSLPLPLDPPNGELSRLKRIRDLKVLQFAAPTDYFFICEHISTLSQNHVRRNSRIYLHAIMVPEL